MHFLVGAAVFLALLYFWLLGHWFARVVVFLILATPCIGLMMFGSPEGIQIGLVFGLATWPIASLPIYYYRQKAKEFCRPLGARMSLTLRD
jgi:hypothetical protein